MSEVHHQGGAQVVDIAADELNSNTDTQSVDIAVVAASLLIRKSSRERHIVHRWVRAWPGGGIR